MAAKIATAELRDAHERIAPFVSRTPLVEAKELSPPGTAVYLKLENLQETGSFKLRGATNAVRQLSATQRACGVVTPSSGNHGLALARAASAAQVRVVVCLPRSVPEAKVAKVREYGAEVRIVGEEYDEAAAEAERLVRESGMVLIPPFDHAHIIAGAGTVGLEIVEDLPNVDSVILPLSGGGLAAGVALAVKAGPRPVRVVGVSMERGATMYESLRAGKPITVEEEFTLADALRGGIGLDNRYTFELVREFVDDSLLVSEEMIAAAMRELYQKHQLTVEGGGAVGLAAVLGGKVTQLGQRCVVVISGGNVDEELFRKVVG